MSLHWDANPKREQTADSRRFAPRKIRPWTNVKFATKMIRPSELATETTRSLFTSQILDDSPLVKFAVGLTSNSALRWFAQVNSPQRQLAPYLRRRLDLSPASQFFLRSNLRISSKWTGTCFTDLNMFQLNLNLFQLNLNLFWIYWNKYVLGRPENV